LHVRNKLVMAVSDDRKYTKAFVHALLEGVKGKTLGDVDKSHQFARTEKSEKITGIAGDVIEQSVFGYERGSKQECDIMQILPNGNLHSIQAVLTLRTNRKANPLCGQTIVSCYHIQTNGLNEEHLLLLQDYTHVRYLGHFSKLRAFAPS